MKMAVFGIKEWYKWDNVTKKPVERLGTIYSGIKHKTKGPVLVSVKVPGEPVVLDETIRNSYKAGAVIWIDFAEYEEDSYSRNGEIHYTATAATATLVDDIVDFA